MSERVCFTVIGYIEWRKGQDILIDAIERMDKGLLSECEFLLIGQDSSLMAGEIRKRIRGIECVKMKGTVDRDEIHRILEKTDMLICPSREDPMPTVCAEAMMHSVPCLVSDSVGTAGYIIDGYDGLLFRCGDAEGLKERIAWCVKNRDELGVMGERAFLIYDKMFSETAFENNLLRYVNGMLSDG